MLESNDRENLTAALQQLVPHMASQPPEMRKHLVRVYNAARNFTLCHDALWAIVSEGGYAGTRAGETIQSTRPLDQEFPL